MARLKEGVDYFPLDVNTDRKFKLVEAKFGVIGFGIIIRIYQFIYAEHGYYCEWDDDTALIMAAENSSGKCQITLQDVQDIVSEAVARDIFDAEMLEKYGILTSKGIQRRYIEMTKRRERVDVINDYLLIDIPQNRDNVYRNGENVYRKSKNVYSNAQSKVKESKVKESKGKETKANTDADAVPKELAFDNEVKEVLDFYQENIAPLTPYIAHSIEDWCKDMEHGAVQYAIVEATKHNARHWKYIEAILKTWHSAGRTTLAEVEDANKWRNAKKNKKDFDVFNTKNTDYDEIEKIIQEKM